MLNVKTYLAASPIHGLGVFAAERVEVGAAVWGFVESLDMLLPIEILNELPVAQKEFVTKFASRGHKQDTLLLCADDARFLNHSPDANTTPIFRDGHCLQLLAARQIKAGDEITENYYLTEMDALDMESGRYVWDGPQVAHIPSAELRLIQGLR